MKEEFEFYLKKIELGESSPIDYIFEYDSLNSSNEEGEGVNKFEY